MDTLLIYFVEGIQEHTGGHNIEEGAWQLSPAVYQIYGPVSEVIFFLSTTKHVLEEMLTEIIGS